MSKKRIVITTSDEDFEHGYQEAYIDFVTKYKETELTDDKLFQVFKAIYGHPEKTDRWKAGYLAGWMAAFYHKSYRFEDTSSQFEVLKGGVAL